MCTKYEMRKIKILKLLALEWNFSLPPGFKKRSYSRLQNCYNGIGAEWMPRWIRHTLTNILRVLEPAALVHDYEWSRRQKSFGKFLKSNLRLCYNAYKSRRFFLGLAAAAICTVFGWKAYLSGKENASERP